MRLAMCLLGHFLEQVDVCRRNEAIRAETELSEQLLGDEHTFRVRLTLAKNNLELEKGTKRFDFVEVDPSLTYKKDLTTLLDNTPERPVHRSELRGGSPARRLASGYMRTPSGQPGRDARRK